MQDSWLLYHISFNLFTPPRIHHSCNLSMQVFDVIAHPDLLIPWLTVWFTPPLEFVLTWIIPSLAACLSINHLAHAWLGSCTMTSSIIPWIQACISHVTWVRKCITYCSNWLTYSLDKYLTYWSTWLMIDVSNCFTFCLHKYNQSGSCGIPASFTMPPSILTWIQAVITHVTEVC
jgi:hypothetical protein